jgi:ppGpp synthetase/RelA/SpoT-type nucleotidyltranferase
MKKPEDITEYKAWIHDHLHADFDNETSRTLYETNINIAQIAIEEHEFFRDLSEKLEEWASSYQAKTGTVLLMTESAPAMEKKEYESAVNKSFRANILKNDRFPDAPEMGWITPKNLYTSFNDAIRGTIVCRFIDGPAYLATKLTEYARSLGLNNKFYSQERDDGYYAYHFYVFIPVKLIDETFRQFEANMEVEIQITTQLQEVLRTLTHKFYEVNRLKPQINDAKWKWDFKSNRFKVSYLSHTLHLLESIIIESRASSMKKSRKAKKQK